tara:strand:- start:1436 stop:2644 length:1209 start_codon:yes stop_codon:yes gene_type:complete
MEPILSLDAEQIETACMEVKAKPLPSTPVCGFDSGSDSTSCTSGELIAGAAGKGIAAASPRIRSNISSQRLDQTTDEEEPLLQPEGDRYADFPINPVYEKAFTAYKTHVACFWTLEEIDLAVDKIEWKDDSKLSDNDRHFVKHVLAFFAGADRIVNANLEERFIQEVQPTEVQKFYRFQMAMEDIHSETYASLIDSLVPADEKQSLFDAIRTMPCVGAKADWAKMWISSDQSFAHRLVAFAIVEGIFFSGSFCAIFWLKKRGLMPGLCFSNELISRDEGLHTQFACMLYTDHIVHRVPRNEIEEMFHEAVRTEKEFVCDALPVGLIGMNATLMCEYIEYVADHLLVALGEEKLFHAKNPFDWMESISLQGKTNFFEKRVGEYQKAGVLADPEKQVFSMEEDF